MEVQFTLNGKKVSTEIAADTVLLNLLRDLGCKSHVRFLQQALTDMK